MGKNNKLKRARKKKLRDRKAPRAPRILPSRTCWRSLRSW